MIPFNLEEALKGKEVITDKGLAVRKVVFIDECLTRPIVALVDNQPYSCNLQGECTNSTGKVFNIYMSPERKTVWVNVYNNGNTLALGRGRHLTEEAALARITKKETYIKTMKIEVD
jgi:hypothetical protein